MNCSRIKSIDRFNNKESSLFARELIKSINKQISSFLLKIESYLIRLSSSIVEHRHVRIMPRASHRNTCKPDDIRVNENSKLKSESYEMRRLYVQKKDER